MSASRPATAVSRIAFALGMVPLAVLAIVHWAWAPAAWSGDYAQYLLHAQALVAGRPYADIGYIYHPAAWAIAPPAFPPALPVTLAPFIAFLGTSASVLRVLALVPLVAFAWVASLRLARAMDPRVAALAAGFAAFAIEARLGAVRPLTDPPFAALVWASFVVVDREGAWRGRRVVVVTLLGFAAMAYRVPGIALIPAMGLYALLHRRRLGWRPFAPASIWLLAGLGGLATGLVANPYADGMRTNLLTSQRAAMLLDNYRNVLAEGTLHPFGNGPADVAYQFVAVLLCVVGLPALARAIHRTLLGTFALVYVVMLLVAPVGELRYAWPLYPLIAAALILGIKRTVEFVGAWRGRSAFAAQSLRVALGAGALIGMLALVAEGRAAPPRTLEGDPDAEAMFGFFRGQEGARVMFHNPRVLTLRTGRPAMGLLGRTTPGQLAGIDEKRLTHFVWQRPDISHCAQVVANALVTQYPERFRLAYANATFRVYAVAPAAEPFAGPFEEADWTRPDAYCPRRVR